MELKFLNLILKFKILFIKTVLKIVFICNENKKV